jgi:hypothetical protein
MSMSQSRASLSSDETLRILRRDDAPETLKQIQPLVYDVGEFRHSTSQDFRYQPSGVSLPEVTVPDHLFGGGLQRKSSAGAPLSFVEKQTVVVETRNEAPRQKSIPTAPPLPPPFPASVPSAPIAPTRPTAPPPPPPSSTGAIAPSVISRPSTSATVHTSLLESIRQAGGLKSLRNTPRPSVSATPAPTAPPPCMDLMGSLMQALALRRRGMKEDAHINNNADEPEWK